MTFFPKMPADRPLVHGALNLRFEDVTQDGRLTLECLPTAVGSVVWPKVLADFSVGRTAPSDVVPILSRLIIESCGGPVSVYPPLAGTGTYEVSHTKNQAQEVERLYVNMWVSLEGHIGHTHGFAVERAGERVEVGRVFAEHVFTRPFAPPADRRVLTFNGTVPDKVYAWRDARTLFAEGEAAVQWLDAEPELDPVEQVFGLVHTDSNQHVNSLVYPRLFEEAALRRLARHGHRKLLGRALELMFRKPSFAGETLRLTVQAGVAGEDFVVRSFIHKEGEPFDKAHAYARLVLRA